MQKWSEMVGLRTKFDVTKNYEVPRYTDNTLDSSAVREMEYEERAIKIPIYRYQTFTMPRSDYSAYKNNDSGNSVCVYLSFLLKEIQQHVNDMKENLHIPNKFNFSLPKNLLDRYAYEWIKLNMDCEYGDKVVTSVLLTKINKIMEQEV